MAETSVGYKCPNCSAPLTFLPGHDKVTCEYCGTELEVKTIEEMYAAKEAAAAKAQAAKEAKWDTSAAGSEWEADEAEQMKAFTCSSCGAQIVSDGNRMLLLRQPDHAAEPLRGYAEAGLHHPLQENQRGSCCCPQGILQGKNPAA